MTVILPQCVFCTHHRTGDTGPVCDAFPDGIPERILRNQFDHRKPHPHDGGVQFNPTDAEAKRVVDAMFREAAE